MPIAEVIALPSADATAANQALLDSWQLSLHGKQPRAVSHYLDEARRFASWLADMGRPADAPGDLLAVERQDVEAWLTAQRAEGRAQATMRNRWIALRNLYGWALAEGEVERSPLERVVVAKGNTPAPDVLTDDDLKLLLKSCAGTDFYARRDTALIRLMLATGLRVSETVDLAIGDLDLANRIVAVRHGKGDKARIVRFDAATAAALDRYKRVRAPAPVRRPVVALDRLAREDLPQGRSNDARQARDGGRHRPCSPAPAPPHLG